MPFVIWGGNFLVAIISLLVMLLCCCCLNFRLRWRLMSVTADANEGGDDVDVVLSEPLYQKMAMPMPIPMVMYRGCWQ